MDVLIKIKDREGVVHELQVSTDMAMNIMELCKAYELPVEGTAAEWPCVLLVNVMCLTKLLLARRWRDEAISEAFTSKLIVV
jgi:2Fe-2S ferredoxin